MTPTRKLAVVLVVALLVRLAAFGATLLYDPSLGATWGGDTPSYVAPARDLARHGTFTQEGVPEIVRTPGYPLLLAVGLRTGHLESFTIFVQILLGVGITALIFATARLVSDSYTVALLAASLYAVEPVSVLFTTRLMSETLFAAFLGVYVWSFCAWNRRPAWGTTVLAGAALACATFVRPITFYLPIAAAGLMLARIAVDRDRWRKQVAQTLLFFAVAMVPLLLWQARNEALAGYGGLSTIREINLYKYHAAMVVAADQRLTLQEAQDRLMAQLAADASDDWDEGDRTTYMKERAFEILAASPITYARVFVQGVVVNLLDPGASKWLRQFGGLPTGSHALEGELFQKGLWTGLAHLARTVPLWLSTNLLLAILLGFLLLTSAWTLVTRFPAYGAALLALLLVAAYFLAISGAMTSSRFRHPVMPILCIVSAMGAVSMRQRLREGWR